MPRQPAGFESTYARLVQRLYRKSGAERWDVSLERLTAALASSVEKRFGGSLSGDVAQYLESLHVEDLALACACIDGHEAAWEHFVTEYRPELYAAARATGNDAAREIADGLYAELFGLDMRDGKRRSLLTYFHGRSKLSTWLRSVLAQRYVDALRAGRRTDSMDSTELEDVASGRHLASQPKETDPARADYLRMLRHALTHALAALEPRERLRLSCYYVQGMTLAQIGRLTGEHEATVSRKLDRARRTVRQAVERRLGVECGLNPVQIDLCYEYALQDWPFDLSHALARANEP
jgi:RNA polymerase sigma-70 factor (ECF subfamily)